MTIFSRAAIAATLLASAAALPAQAATVVAPGAYAGTDAPSGQFGVFGNPANSAATFQFVVAASQLSGITTGAQISSIGFRFAGYPYLAPSGTLNYSRYDVQIGRATNTTTSLSTNFAANMGADAVVARSGALTIPASAFAYQPGDSSGTPGSAATNFYNLAFTTPYTYSGGDLAVTIRMAPTNGNSAVAVDAFTADSRINTVFAFGNASATSGNVGEAFAPVTQITFNATAAVPEPGTWAMMIVGFGVVGGTMRRRSRRVAAFA